MADADLCVSEHKPASSRVPLLLLVLSYVAFVSLGLPDAVLGMAWPAVRAAFELPQAALGTPLAAGALTYFVSGMFAGRLLQRLGVGNLLAVSTLLVVVGVSGYALSTSFSVFVAAACLVGFGSGAIDSGLNTYAAERLAPRHMSWLHAAYSLGAAQGAAILTLVVALGHTFRSGYLLIAAGQLALGVAFVLARDRWDAANRTQASSPGTPSEQRTAASSAWAAARDGRVLLQAAIFFVYSGVEVGAGQWSYTLLVQSRALGANTAGAWVTTYWALLLLGRIASGFVVERLGIPRLLRAATLLAAVGAALFASSGLPVVVTCLGLGLIGLSLAPIYPGLMSATPERVGAARAAHAVGFQVSAAVMGVALLPAAAGLAGERYGLEAIGSFIAGCALVLCVLHELLVRWTAGTARAAATAAPPA